MQGSTKRFPGLSAGQRAEYDNEEHRHNGLPEAQIPYTDEEIKKFYNGTDPDYPNSDWFSETIRPWAPQQNHNLSVRGGSEKIKYYGYFGYNNQETIIRHDGGRYTRYNLQSNIDAKITDRITASVDLSMQYRQHLSTSDNSTGHENMWMSIYESDPRFATHLPDPDKLAYNNHFTGNPVYFSSTELGGYTNATNITFRSSGSLAYKFKYIEGLQAKIFINFNYGVGRHKEMTKSRDFYTYNYAADKYTWARSSLKPTSINMSYYLSPSLTQQYSLSYNNLFNKAHNVSAIVVYETISSSNSSMNAYREGFKTYVIEELSAGDSNTAKNGSSTSENGRISCITRLNYSYKDRYLFEGIFRADASARFAPGRRWGYFPSISLGWVISQEQFMQSLKALDNLKLRLSEGQSGYDNVGNFDYLNTYGIDKNYIFGDETITGLYQTRVANPDFTWETMTIYNAGLDFSFFNRKLYGTGEFFYRKREGILGTRANSLPSSFGQIPPIENLNSQDTRGFEFMIGTAGKVGDFSYDISGNISWSRSKWIKYDEPEHTDPDNQRISLRTGRWTDVRYGYVSDGLFTSQAEIDALNYYYADLGSNANIRPGDIKYKNLNGDSKLDWRDVTILGAGNTPHWMYGINTYFRYNNFDLSMLFQGAFDYTTSVYLDPRLTKYGFEHRWTEENNDPHALLPRLASKSLNLYSDFYVHQTSYIRLKNMALGYDLPSELLKKFGIEKLRVYIAGTNLFTLSTLNKYGVDPEMPEGSSHSYYPQQRTFSMGLNLSF
jgi:TonB-linked SusC/RagA family outer membrane protein